MMSRDANVFTLLRFLIFGLNLIWSVYRERKCAGYIIYYISFIIHHHHSKSHLLLLLQFPHPETIG